MPAFTSATQYSPVRFIQDIRQVYANKYKAQEEIENQYHLQQLKNLENLENKFNKEYKDYLS